MPQEKINIAELLKECQKGMELDCQMYDNLYFKCIREHPIYPIVCYTIDSKGEEYEIMFNRYGKYVLIGTAKCIFPKGKTTWEGFVPPCMFKDGDIVATTDGTWIGITTGGEKGKFIPTYCVITSSGKIEVYFDRKETWNFNRRATEEEKIKLFQTLKDNGYKWNADTKTLEKLIESCKEDIEETIIDTIKESADRYRIKVNYQFDIEVDEGEYYAVRRKPQNTENVCEV